MNRKPEQRLPEYCVQNMDVPRAGTNHIQLTESGAG